MGGKALTLKDSSLLFPEMHLCILSGEGGICPHPEIDTHLLLLQGNMFLLPYSFIPAYNPVVR